METLFISGAPRSGTTLLNMLLNSHPDIRICNEVNIVRLHGEILRLYYREQRLNELFLQPHRNRSSREKWRFDNILSAVPLKSSTYDMIMKVLLNNGEGHFKVVGDKLPLYYKLGFEKIWDIFPGAKIVHISRRPFRVINSMITRRNNARKGLDLWDPYQSIESMINDWIHAWEYTKSFCNDERVFHMNYSNLTSSGRLELAEMLTKLKLGVDVDQFEFSDLEPETANFTFYGSDREFQVLERSLGEVDLNWNRGLASLQREHPLLQLNEPVFRMGSLNRGVNRIKRRLFRG